MQQMQHYHGYMDRDMFKSNINAILLNTSTSKYLLTEPDTINSSKYNLPTFVDQRQYKLTAMQKQKYRKQQSKKYMRQVLGKINCIINTNYVLQ